ncbi:hypothetical protein [Amnibacterium endophyticum]|uniref:Sensor domain-containing protein n=1 Tax=Amnibacterium endophyticum TaxID=2109337 RepID=A0ABW4LBW7_9MICO
MTEASGRTDLAARYPRRELPGAATLRAHPPLRNGPLAVAGWAAALVLAELLVLAVAGALLGFALLDVLLVPGGLVAGCCGLAVRRRRRAAAERSARSWTPEEAAHRAATLPAARFAGAAQQWDLLVHAALLVNLALFGALLVADASSGSLLIGPVLIASALIPVSLLSTWLTAGRATAEGEALALVHRIGRPDAVRRARWLVRIALAPHVLLAVAAIVSVLFI